MGARGCGELGHGVEVRIGRSEVSALALGRLSAAGADSRAAPRGGVRRRRRAARPVVLERPADSTSLKAAVRRRSTSQLPWRRGASGPRLAGSRGRPGTDGPGCSRGTCGPLDIEASPASARGVQLADRGRRRGGRRASPGVRPGCEGPRCAFTCGRLLERKHRAVAEATALLDWRLAPVWQRARAELGSGMLRLMETHPGHGR